MKILTIFGFIVVTSFFIGACIAAIDVNEQDLARPCYNARLEELVYFLFNTSPATYLTTDLKEFILKYHLQMDYKLVTSLCMVSSSHFRVPFFETFLSDPHDLELWIALPDLNPFEKLTFTVLHGVPTGGTNTELIFLLLCRSILPELPQESLRDIYFFLVFATCRSGRSFLRIFIDVLKFDVSIWHWMTYIPDDIYDCILRKFNAVEFRGIFYKCSEVKNSIVPFIKHCLSLNLLDSSCVFEDFSLIPTYDIGSDIGLAHTLDKLVAEENYFEIERIFRTHPDISCDPLENYFWSSELLSLLAGISKSPHDLYWWNHFIDRDTTVPTLIYDLILRRTFGKKLTASLKKYQVMGQIGVLLAYLSVDQMENVRVILEEDNILKDYSSLRLQVYFMLLKLSYSWKAKNTFAYFYETLTNTGIALGELIFDLEQMESPFNGNEIDLDGLRRYFRYPIIFLILSDGRYLEYCCEKFGLFGSFNSHFVRSTIFSTYLELPSTYKNLEVIEDSLVRIQIYPRSLYMLATTLTSNRGLKFFLHQIPLNYICEMVILSKKEYSYLITLFLKVFSSKEDSQETFDILLKVVSLLPRPLRRRLEACFSEIPSRYTEQYEAWKLKC